MTPDDITLGQARAMLGSNDPLLISLDWLMAANHAARVEILNRAIDLACASIVKSRHLKKGFGEDALTVEIVSSLEFMSIDASHDTDVGGHADIVVRSKDNFLWIAEAKLHRSYVWLLEGFDQLTTRYTTGLPGQQDGAVIIYCFNENAAAVMDEWIARLSAAIPDVDIQSGAGLYRNSTHVHKGAGTPFRVRHCILPLYWSPAKKRTK